MIAHVHNMVCVNCSTGTYFFPKQTAFSDQNKISNRSHEAGQCPTIGHWFLLDYTLHYCFFYLFLSGFPFPWHASTSFVETLTPISESTEITVSSKSLSETCPGIPQTTILFLQPYCSNALTEDSLDTTSFSSLLHFSHNFLFSSCSLLIAMSLRFIMSSLRQFMVEIMFSSTLASASLLTTVSFLVRLLYSWVITLLISEQENSNQIKLWHHEIIPSNLQ